MKPTTSSTSRFDLFQANFKQILNLNHEPCLVADAIDWSGFESQFTDCYSDDMGRPGNDIRLMVGLQYLKHAFGESDESVIDRWVENPCPAMCYPPKIRAQIENLLADINENKPIMPDGSKRIIRFSLKEKASKLFAIQTKGN